MARVAGHPGAHGERLVERGVKERLIGACILVALAVALVPELLSGPKPAAPADAEAAADAVRLPAGAPDPVRNVTVDLATAKPAMVDPAVSAAAPQSMAAGAAPTGAAPTSAAPTSAAPTSAAPTGAAPASSATTSAPTVAAPASSAPTSAPTGTAPVHSLETTALPPTSGQTFAVQLGSFANRSNADKLVHQLKAQGFAIYMNAEGSGAAARYRVRVGPLADRDAAERMIAKLKGLGHVATIVSPR